MRLRFGFVGIMWLVCGSVWAAPPTEADIAKAIRELGDKRFAVREKAGKFLWQTGAAAEPFLRQAVANGDAETVRRAKIILEKFDSGIYPDTPPEVVEAIVEYRNGDRNRRIDVAGRLVGHGRFGLQALLKMASLESEGDRKAIFTQIATDASHGIGKLIAAGDFATAETVLELGVTVDAEPAFSQYAALLALRRQLDPAIAKYELERKKNPPPRSAMVALIYLYRAKGDVKSAVAVARELNDDILIEAVLWEAGDWNGLSDLVIKSGSKDLSALGMRIAFLRAAGRTSEAQKALEEARARATVDDRYEARGAIEAMLLNDAAVDAMKIAVDRKISVELVFDLLCVQLRYQEAFALADAVQNLDVEEAFQLKLRRARAHYLLGQKDQALTILTALADSIKDHGQSHLARDLVKTLVRVGLKDQAAGFLVRYMPALETDRSKEMWSRLVEPLFGPNADSFMFWWFYLRQKEPGFETRQTMRLVRQLFEPAAVEKRVEYALELANYGRRQADGTEAWDAQGALLAAVSVLQIGGERTQALDLLKSAVKSHPEYRTCLALGDALAKATNWSDAAAAYAKAAEQSPGTPLPLFLRGQALIRSGDDNEGRRLVDLAHWLPLGSMQERGKFAEELSRRGYAADALRERRFVVDIGWYSHWSVGNILNHLSREALDRKDYAASLALTRRAIFGCLRMGASYVEPSAYLVVPQSIHQLQARSLLAEKRIDEATPHIETCLTMLPGNMDLLNHIVPALDRLGKKDVSDKYYQPMAKRYLQLAADYPDSAYAHNAVAWLAANCRRDLDRALEHAQTAVRLDAKSVGYLDTLAEVHFRRGERDKAVELMRQCIARTPNRTYYKLQLARFQSGDVDSSPPDADDD